MAEIPVFNPEPGRIMLRPDNFHEKAKRYGASINTRRQDNSKTGQVPRRPYEGIALKGDTYASLSVIGYDGETIPLVSPNYEGDTNTVEEYTDFILQTVEETRVEKQQIVNTFGDSYIFFYGEEPRIITFAGVLINTVDYNWRSQFWKNYDENLRGTKLVEANARAYLSWDTIVVEGYPLQARASDNSDQPNLIPFQFQMLVTNYFDYSNAGARYFPPEGLVTTRNENATQDPEVIAATATARLSIPPPTDQFGRPIEPVTPLDELQRNLYKIQARVMTSPSYHLRRFRNRVADLVDNNVVTLAIKKHYIALHNAFTQAGGIADDLMRQVQAANNYFSMVTGLAFPIGLQAAHIATNFDEWVDPYTKAVEEYFLSGERVLENTKSMITGGAPINVKARGGSNTTALTGGSSATGIGSKGSGSAGTSQAGFIGGSGAKTFGAQRQANTETLEGGGTLDPSLGDQYSQAAYADTTGAQTGPVYEQVYEDRNYSEALADDPALVQSLDEAYGDVDSSSHLTPKTFEDQEDPYGVIGVETVPIADAEPGAMEDVYYQGVSSTYRNTIEEILKLLREAGIEVENDVDTSGIRGVDDDDADIEPIA